MMSYQRTILSTLQQRLQGQRPLIQALLGPRQVGKTTLCHQFMAQCHDQKMVYVSADEMLAGQELHWLAQQWQIARIYAKQSDVVLFIDEIQKIPQWSTQVKALWDEDQSHGVEIKVVVLGSSPLLMNARLTESLAGRFEVIPVTHWTYQEMRDAFDVSLEEYIYFGGYPGAIAFKAEHTRWRHYVRESLIEPSISKDILLLNRVDKPALLRQLFYVGCGYSGQVLSFHKILGTLQDAGNTTTLAHYLKLLAGAGLLSGLEKYAQQMIRTRASSPKFQVFNTALMSALQAQPLTALLHDTATWGRLVESAVGAHLVNGAMHTNLDILYWNQSSHEVDFIIRSANKTLAIEVKSGAKATNTKGMALFKKAYPDVDVIMVGGQGVPLDTFLLSQISDWVDSHCDN